MQNHERSAKIALCSWAEELPDRAAAFCPNDYLFGGFNENLTKSNGLQSFSYAQVPSLCSSRRKAGKEDLPSQAKEYIKRIEEYIGVPIKFIGVGAGREEIIVE